MKKTTIIIILLFFTISNSFCQKQSGEKKQYKICTIAFYNCENLFDTIAQPNDSEFTPEGINKWNTPKYYEKMRHLAQVISQIGVEETGMPPAVIGLSEIENISVLEDLVKTEPLKKFNYQIVHRDGSDYRGVDCALLYRPEIFKVNTVSMYVLKTNIPNFITRDQITISGDFDGEEMTFIVNHWPSRRGGEKASAPKRNAAADLSRHIVDSVLKNNKNAKIIVMGDLNDDPTDQSVKKHLITTDKKEKAFNGIMFNPMEVLFKKGIGSLAYNDKWNLFDQIIISPGFVLKEGNDYKFYQAHIFNKSFLLQQDGRFKGYPFRTYVGGTYVGGYSDHLPSFITIIKEIK
ncbi:MAG: endonuclease/exonuclease/phosphatase family protein [Bacteroidales bacterium]|jgi:exonuclease III|nr:endonuclease/exonuclease/phosphatase family protein [Bacteroidales bacterium]